MVKDVFDFFDVLPGSDSPLLKLLDDNGKPQIADLQFMVSFIERCKNLDQLYAVTRWLEFTTYYPFRHPQYFSLQRKIVQQASAIGGVDPMHTATELSDEIRGRSSHYWMQDILSLIMTMEDLKKIYNRLFALLPPEVSEGTPSFLEIERKTLEQGLMEKRAELQKPVAA